MITSFLRPDASRAHTIHGRPGMRYGPVPHRNQPATASSALDRWVTRLKTRLTPHHPVNSDDWLQSMHQRMREYAQLDLVERRKTLELIVTSMLRDRNNVDSSQEMLAFAATVANFSLGLVPHDGQLIAARELLRGRFVEMGTGEGKTLTMALAAVVSAQYGTPVHVLTSSDYLAQRDAVELAPLYQALNVSVSFVIPGMSEDERRGGYRADIVHVTGKQVAFDWLRDQQSATNSVSGLASRLGNLLQGETDTSEITSKPLLRGLCLAIVDEADSLLIDEARTPLVLSVPVQTNKHNREVSVVALTLARLLKNEVDFTVNAGKRLITLTAEGKITLRKLATRFEGLWGATRYRDEKVREALTVLHCWFRDRDYVVRDNRIELVDPHTGRGLPDRRLPHGLQRVLELKERCEVSSETDVVTSLPFQRFFQSYIALAGMSGTLKEVKGELASVYGVDVVCIPSHKPSKLTILPTEIFESDTAQLNSMIQQVRLCLEQQRAVLIGTRTVEQSESISSELGKHAITHRLLNASQDSEEAAVISDAGKSGQVTVATNMAGRGTDIRLESCVCNHGGLHVIAMAFNDSHRIDRQLAGRAARQGDPGSCIRLLSLNDQSLSNEMPQWFRNWIAWLVVGDASQKQEIGFTNVTRLRSRGTAFAKRCLLRWVQNRIERKHAIERQRSLDTCKRVSHFAGIGALREFGR